MPRKHRRFDAVLFALPALGRTAKDVYHLQAEAELSNAFMMKELDGANLTRTQLDGADLTDVLLRRANLNDAYLLNANLKRADLRETDLEDADLTGADLSGADLECATGITVEELEAQAASLEGATMPDGTKHD